MQLNLEAWVRGDGSDALLRREWLVTNALGGYASGTIAGVATRRFHGILIASLHEPRGRVMLFNHLQEHLHLPDGMVLPLGAEETAQTAKLSPESGPLTQFRLEDGLPVWMFSGPGFILEKRILMPHLQNTTLIRYELLEGSSGVSIRLRPSLHFRHHEDLVTGIRTDSYGIRDCGGNRWEIEAAGDDFPALRVHLVGQVAGFEKHRESHPSLIYRVEQSRGYDSEGPLWTPGTFQLSLQPGKPGSLVASCEPWEMIEALSPAEAWRAERSRRRKMLKRAESPEGDSFDAHLVLAADQFIVTPASRTQDRARAHATGEEPHTVIAGYHWFTDWGRDTMISLDGLTLVTRRYREAAAILRVFASYVKDGLIPNMFPEGEAEGLYHTADASMWFFHALSRYLEETGDRELLRELLPTLVDIIDHHIRGTRFNIGVDERDGLLRQGAEGYQLTWMDAKVDGWVVTPRRGKAVEINALYYNALCCLQSWLTEEGRRRDAGRIQTWAERARDSFNRRFWYEEGGYLYDVVDGEKGDDSSFRPNQVFSISLPYPVLEERRWAAVVESVGRQLLTSVGLRSLAPGSPDYKKVYFGDLRSRDAAYHQGTVWGWLIGPWIDAWLKVHPGSAPRAKSFLDGFIVHLRHAGLGTISEIFDAEHPHTPRGCIAQAWSVAEVLRCWRKVAGAI